ncbi:MAG TPA: DUF222 domain-containing protein, partial [Kofleriaceae bacterium]
SRCEQVHRRLRRIVKARGALDAQEAAALREAQALKLWRRYGYASLIEYLELEMGYTPRAAVERLRVAKAIEELPVIADALSQGDLSFSAAKEITRIATPETEQQWLGAVSDKNVREVEELVSGRQRGDTPETPPDPKLRMKVLRYDVRPETAALEREARQKLQKERGERLDDDAFLRAIFHRVLDDATDEGADCACEDESGASSDREAEGSQPRKSTRVNDRARYQVAAIVCSQCKRGWQDSGGVTIEMSPAAVETALCDAEHIGSLEGDQVERAKQTIPPAVRRKVKRRDHGRCRAPACRSSFNLDLHHIVPREQGGTNDVENLLTLCEGHHLAHHAGALLIEGPASAARFTKRAHNSFTIAKHAVDTARVLKELGFDKHEVKRAIEKTRAHVGTAELAVEQWIKLALSYCPKPTTS